MKKAVDKIEPDWHWGSPEGSREFDRLIDRGMTFHETLEWLEEQKRSFCGGRPEIWG